MQVPIDELNAERLVQRTLARLGRAWRTTTVDPMIALRSE